MTAPIGSHIRERLEPVRNAMVDLFLVRIGFGVALTDALGNDALVALGVASVFAVLALHAGRVFEEIAAESTAHDVVELMLDKLVAVHLVDFLLALADGALSTETDVDGSSIFVLLDKVHLELDLSHGLEVEP